MNWTLLAAALLAAFTTLLHLVAGGDSIAAPLLASRLAPEPRFTLYAVWHMASIALATSAVALFGAALPRHAQAMRALARFIGLQWVAFGLLFILVAVGEPGSGGIWGLPQWVLLLPVGLLALWGSRPGAGKR